MKKLVYYILLSISALSFSACTDYINVDKYFYDQVSLDSAFSKRIYVDGWLSSAYSVMNKLGEYKEPFRWASDDLYHPDMKEYVEGSYSADKPRVMKMLVSLVYGNIMKVSVRHLLSWIM